MSQIEFELGAIAHKCLQTYLEMGKNYYNGYKPMGNDACKQTSSSTLSRHITASFKEADAVTLQQAYAVVQRVLCLKQGSNDPCLSTEDAEELRN
jgi:hypothetical protein